MQRRLALLTLCIFLIAGVFLAWSQLSGSWNYMQPPLPAQPGTYQQAAVEWNDVPVKTSERAAVVTEGAAASEPEAYRKALSGLRGRLVWNAGRRPIPGVRVRIAELWLDALSPQLDEIARLETVRSPVLFRAEATTDAEGYFQLQGLHSRATLVLAIGLKTDKAAVRLIDRAPAPGELLDLGDVVLMERGSVTGRIVDESANPVAGARVRVADLPQMAWQFGAEQFDPEGMMLIVQGPYRLVLRLPPWAKDIDEMLPFGDVRTDADGQFTVTGVQPGTPRLIVTKPNNAPLTRAVTVTSDQSTELGDLTLSEGEYLSGRFVDDEGKPVTGIQIAAGGVITMAPAGFISRPSFVDAKGRFELAGLPRLPLYLCYRRAEGEPWEVSGPHRGDADVTIKLRALGQGAIHIRTNSGEPLEDVEFSLNSADESAYMPGLEVPIPTKTHITRDATKPGVWRVHDLPKQIYKVIARAPGYALGTGVLDLRKKSKSTTTEITLQRAPTTRFEVTDQRGNPVHAARIYWNARRASNDKKKRERMTRTPLLIGQTDAEGVLVTNTIAAEAKFIFCRHPAYAMAAVESIPPGMTPTVRFVLGQSGRLSGLLAMDGVGPDESRTILASPTRDLRKRFEGVLTPRFTAVLPDGSFHFSDLQPGEWKVRSMPPLGSAQTPLALFRLASDKSQQGARAKVVIEAGQESFVQLEMKASATDGTGRIVGSVRIAGKPLVGAQVTTWAGRQRAVVAEDGSFELTGLRDGNLWIGVEQVESSRTLERLWEGRILIQDGSTESLHLDLQLTDLNIRITDDAGEAVPGVPLELRGIASAGALHSGASRLTGKTDSSGELRFSAVPIGPHQLRSAMQRSPRWVIQTQTIDAYLGIPTVQATASQPTLDRGTIVWDESGLQSEAERAFARRFRPKYLVFEADGRFRWGPIRRSDGKDVFRLEPGAPGTYRLRSKSKLRWHSSPLVVPVARGQSLTLRLRPDAQQVQAAVQKSR